jgi:hypothetical protein
MLLPTNLFLLNPNAKADDDNHLSLLILDSTKIDILVFHQYYNFEQLLNSNVVKYLVENKDKKALR